MHFLDDQRIHNDKKLDLIVAVDCATGNPVVLKRLRRQLISAINSVFEILKDLDFRLALISYQNHLDMTRHGQGAGFVHNTAILERFTSNKEKMKNNINSLRCMGRKGHQKGLADGLALAVHLSEGISTGDPQRCRKEAVKVCVLLRKFLFRSMTVANLDYFYVLSSIFRSSQLFNVTLEALTKRLPGLNKITISKFIIKPSRTHS